MDKRRVALITGAGGYIGGECAVTLAKEGKTVAVCDINEAGIHATVERILALGGGKGSSLGARFLRGFAGVLSAFLGISR